MNKKELKLFLNCINYIDMQISSYSDMIDTFKKLGFNKKDLIKYGIKDLELEKELNKKENR